MHIASFISSIGMNFYNPLAILLISPFPISIFSLYNLSLAGLTSQDTIFPTLISNFAMSGTLSSSTAFFYGFFCYCYCYCFCFYCCFSFFGYSFFSSSPPYFLFYLSANLASFFYCALERGFAFSSSGKETKRSRSLTSSSIPGRC